ncbi:MAG: hypothetical protein KF849_12510 [Rhizobiaceae bacterium]|nr:hypothetical protein [Rhizobiaceae bacterium]
MRVLSLGLAGASALALGGCMGSPTYGTNKTANAQLISDLSGALSLGLGDSKRNEIEYQPRPELVKPQTTAVLPPPQDSVTASTAAGWPESPEQRMARIRREATENQDNPAYRSPVVNDIAPTETAALTPGQQREEFRRMRRESAGSATERRVLSEPPLEYRVPADTAPMGDLGVSEDKKERQAKRDAKNKRKSSNRGAIGEPPVTQ